MAGGTVVAFAGPIGSGKSNLSTRVATLLGWPRVSFGDYIRKVARENHQNEGDRAVLQKLGQALILSSTEEFVKNVLAEGGNWREQGNLIVDGLRHVEVRQLLLKLSAPNAFKLVFLSLDETTRRQRAQTEKATPIPQLIRYDQDITEAQIPRILPQYADITIDNALPIEIAAKEVLAKLGLSAAAAAAE